MSSPVWYFWCAPIRHQNEFDAERLGVAHQPQHSKKSWHERYGKAYIPLKWSDALKQESKLFAEKLARSSCGLYHDQQNIHGENLAANSGTGSWANVRSTDSIVTRWVEDEASDRYPDNGHLTQVLWRGTQYIGCGEAERPKEVGGKCHVQKIATWIVTGQVANGG
ncbi:hypothetical protein ACHAWF_006485 [Thalassiosira exigua]